MVFNKSVLICRLHKRAFGKVLVYDVVLTFKSKKRGGLVLAKLGHLNLSFNQKAFFLDLEVLAYWLNNGVQLSRSLKRYLANFITI